MSCADECEKAYLDCSTRCSEMSEDDIPTIFSYLSLPTYLARICYPKCMAVQAACLAKCAAEEAVDDVAEYAADVAGRAAQFVRDHPGLVIGTIVVIGGIALVATTGPGGVMVLVAATQSAAGDVAAAIAAAAAAAAPAVPALAKP